MGEYSVADRYVAGSLDEPGATADRAERVDDTVVLGEMPGVRLVDGHPADRVDEHDVVDDRLERDRVGQPGHRRGTGRGDEVGPAAADLDQLDQDRQRDLLGRLGADVEPGRRPERGDPLVADGRLLAQPVADHPGAGRRRDEPDVRRLAGQRQPDRLLVPDALAGDDDVRRRLRVEAADVGRGVDAGARERVGLGDRVDDA